MNSYCFRETMILIMHILCSVCIVTSFHYFPYTNGTSNASIDRDHSMFVNLTLIPHHVLVVYKTWYCSGSLTSSRIVITVASCFLKRKGDTVHVKVGAESMTAIGQVIPVVEVKTHEYFKRLSEIDNDIALLVLEHNVVFSDRVKKILFSEANEALRVNTPLLVFGWGGTDQPLRNLNMPLCSEMTVITEDSCRNHYGHLKTPSNFCVSFKVQRRLSDNGGSAMYNDWLVGLLSAGGTDTRKPHIALLTNISYFNRWINLNTYKLLNKYCIAKESYEYYNFYSIET